MQPGTAPAADGGVALGKQIRLIGVGVMPFPNGASALVFRYETDVTIEDMPALEKEVDEIWSIFQDDVERAPTTNGIVSANEKPHGVLLNVSRSKNFVFARDASGKWGWKP